MTENNTSNLPILDDIIKPGDADKQAQSPENNDQNSLWHDDDTADPAAMDVYADAGAAREDEADIIDLASNDQHGNNMLADPDAPSTAEIDMQHAHTEPAAPESSANSGEAQQEPVKLPDIDALTEEILDSMLPELEQVLREKIWLALGKHFPGDTNTD